MFRLAKEMHIDVREVEEWPYSLLVEWAAVYQIEHEEMERQRREQQAKAKSGASRGKGSFRR